MKNSLSGCELKAVQLACDGLGNVAIGQRMKTTEHVARNYLRRAADKLGVSTGTQGRTRAQLGRWYGENYPRQ